MKLRVEITVPPYVVLRGGLEPERVAGRLLVHAEQGLVLSEINISLTGRLAIDTPAARSMRLVHLQSQSLTGSKGKRRVKRGVHTFPFEFDLPPNLPCSLSSQEPRVMLLYALRANVMASALFDLSPNNFVAEQPLVLVRSFQPDAPEFVREVPVQEALQSGGTCAVTMPHSAWAAGDTVLAVLRIVPGIGAPPPAEMSVSIVQVIDAGPVRISKRTVVTTRRHLENRQGSDAESLRRTSMASFARRSSTASSARRSSSSSLRPDPSAAPDPRRLSAPSGTFPRRRSDASAPRTQLPALDSWTPGEVASASSSTRNSQISTPRAASLAPSGRRLSSGSSAPPSIVISRRDSAAVDLSDSDSEDDADGYNADTELPAGITEVLDMALPQSMLPSLDYEALRISYRLIVAVVFAPGGPDEGPKKRTCTLPLRVLSKAVLADARAAGTPARRALLGAAWEEDYFDLPSYSLHDGDPGLKLVTDAQVSPTLPMYDDIFAVSPSSTTGSHAAPRSPASSHRPPRLRSGSSSHRPPRSPASPLSPASSHGPPRLARTPGSPQHAPKRALVSFASQPSLRSRESSPSEHELPPPSPMRLHPVVAA